MNDIKTNSLRPALRRLLERQEGRCFYCGQALAPWRFNPDMPDAAGVTVDHVLPRARGGRNFWLNKVAACRPCNLEKGDRLPTWREIRRAEALHGKLNRPARDAKKRAAEKIKGI